MIKIKDFFKVGPSSFLGIDIGTSVIKIVELSQYGKRKKLDNYGQMQAVAMYEKPFRTFEKSTLTVSSSDVVRAVTAILGEAKMKSKKAYFSIPDFSTFFTNFKLPGMTKDELPNAVQYEARQHIPLPLSEVVLDWQVVGQKTINQKISDFNILLVAVPLEVIEQYRDIAKFSNLEMVALEAEVFGLVRAVIGNENKESAILIDLGARSTTISVVDAGVIKLSHSFDTAGNDFTSLIARASNIDMAQAEEIKKKQGLQEAIMPMVDLIISEVKKISQNFYSNENKIASKIILAGGSALMPGLAGYFKEATGIDSEVASPFANLYYPPILDQTLKELGPSYAVALGAALRGLD
ncbi:MAG: type IV pilus assembly protein PilM [Candidatus Nealsonbacteria bacterium]|nr:type IV pilus assembly protein PilM [Candidatus Nealsonbacteria bacterium]